MADSTFTGVINSTALSVARDCLAGSSKDYVFFCSSDNHFLLIQFDSSEETAAGLILSDCLVTEIEYHPPVFQPAQPSDYTFHVYSQQSFLFANPDEQLSYSSFEGYPHLQSGGEYYAFLSCVLLCTGFAFLLLRRIFKFLCP